MDEKKINKFLKDIKAVCKKHNMALYGNCISQSQFSEIGFLSLDDCDDFEKVVLEERNRKLDKNEFTIELIAPQERLKIMLNEEQKKQANEADEITLYFIINECGSFIWNMTHQMSHGRIEFQHVDAINNDISKTRELQQYAVSLLPKFGVETPTEGVNNAPTAEYWKWFRWWDSYIKGLSNEEWAELDMKISTKGDYTSYRPQGNWKE